MAIQNPFRSDSSVPQSTDELTLIPSGTGGYLEMWSPLLDLEKVAIPVQGATPGGPTNEDEALAAIDSLTWSDGAEHKFGLVYTDADLLTPFAMACHFPTGMALNHLFHRPNLCGVVFNQTVNSNCPTPPAGTTLADLSYDSPWTQPAGRETLGRVLGMLFSDDPFAGSGYTPGSGAATIDDACAARHADLAEQAGRADRPLEALHHATCARRGDLPVDDWFFTELDAALELGLTDRAIHLVNWYRTECGEPESLRLRLAYLLTITAQPEQAIDIAAPLVDHDELGATACVELARAHYVASHYDKAIASFEAARDRGDDRVDSLIGLGMSLRLASWDSSDEHGLARAGECFEQAIQIGNYRKPEAQHYLSTIRLAQHDFQAGEILAREAIASRGYGIARRNLVLFLQAQGRMDEAYEQYRILSTYDALHAQGLEHAFAGFANAGARRSA